MKLKQFLKTMSLVLTTTIPLVATTMTINSCGHNKKAEPSKPTLYDFVKKSESESAINIVNDASIKAKGWNNLSASDVTNGKFCSPWIRGYCDNH